MILVYEYEYFFSLCLPQTVVKHHNIVQLINI